MSATSSHARDDALTVAAIGALAACIVTASHEAVGHGFACLLSGGHVVKLTSVYFQCDVASPWVAIGGPIGNLVAAVIAWLLSRAISPTALHGRFLLLMIAALALFWEGGYLAYAMSLREGDWYFAARDTFGTPDSSWRFGGYILCVALYSVGIRAVRDGVGALGLAGAEARRTLRIAWSGATLAACSAALAYAPAPFEALRQAVLEIGAAAWPLVLPPQIPTAQMAPRTVLGRRPGWIVAALAASAIFVITLGVGVG